MTRLAQIKTWWKKRRPPPLDQWFFVTFDDTQVFLKVSPPGSEKWEQSFPWSAVTKICFKDEGLYQSDRIYVYTSMRPEPFVIPTEANGGHQFFGELAGRGLFPAEIMTKAISATDGGLYCWPAQDPADTNG